MKWKLEDGTRCRAYRATLRDIDDIVYLPANWATLLWYRVSSSPDLWGGDLMIALDAGTQLGYCIHDCNCQAYAWSGGIHEFIHWQNDCPPEGGAEDFNIAVRSALDGYDAASWNDERIAEDLRRFTVACKEAPTAALIPLIQQWRNRPK